ncbi:MAG: DUF456 domain-containing protein [Spirochaetes bacterium]|jgi:uncharacterized protein YqgC (DUF456 family)|nr:DUF456 domain-containing protein [Spirochaetota bacterium]
MAYIHEIVLIIAVLFGILGIIGSVVPVIPGPFVSLVALLLLNWTRFADISMLMLVVAAFFSVLITILDYVLPSMGSLKYGGTKRGSLGATIGLFVGIIFFPPVGLFLGAFLGALIGELSGGMELDPALKASFGAFMGVISGVVVKFILSSLILILMIVHIVRYF